MARISTPKRRAFADSHASMAPVGFFYPWKGEPALGMQGDSSERFFRVYLKVGSNLAPNEARFRGAQIGVDGECFGVPC